MNPLPILNYHGIESWEGEYDWTPTERTYVIGRRTFEAQLDRLVSDGFVTLSLDELSNRIGEYDQEKRILLTFDDAHVSHLEHVLPGLKKRSLKGIFFVPTGLVGKTGQMGWAELRELVKQGFEVGSHGHQHIPLTNLPLRELEAEIELSKKMLEDRLGIEVTSFSVPRGFYHPRIKKAAVRAGYRFVFTSQFGLNRKKLDFFSLKRLALTRAISMNRFSELLQGKLGAQRYSEPLKEFARRFVSPTVYRQLADIKSRVAVGGAQ